MSDASSGRPAAFDRLLGSRLANVAVRALLDVDAGLEPVDRDRDALGLDDERSSPTRRDDSVDAGVDVLAQVQAEAVATWHSPQHGKPTVRGVERLRAWCEGFSLREALDRLCRLCGRPHKRH